jgi:hypothetical protein
MPIKTICDSSQMIPSVRCISVKNRRVLENIDSTVSSIRISAVLDALTFRVGLRPARLFLWRDMS